MTSVNAFCQLAYNQTGNERDGPIPSTRRPDPNAQARQTVAIPPLGVGHSSTLPPLTNRHRRKTLPS